MEFEDAVRKYFSEKPYWPVVSEWISGRAFVDYMFENCKSSGCGSCHTRSCPINTGFASDVLWGSTFVENVRDVFKRGMPAEVFDDMMLTLQDIKE